MINPVFSFAVISLSSVTIFIHSILVSDGVAVYCFSLSYIFIVNSSNINGKELLELHPVRIITIESIIREYRFMEYFKLNNFG